MMFLIVEASSEKAILKNLFNKNSKRSGIQEQNIFLHIKTLLRGKKKKERKAKWNSRENENVESVNTEREMSGVS